MTKAAAIYQFWNSFGLTAYEENTVPDDAAFPYITYQLVTPCFSATRDPMELSKLIAALN